MINWFIKLSFQTFQALIVIYRMGIFVYHLWRSNLLPIVLSLYIPALCVYLSVYQSSLPLPFISLLAFSYSFSILFPNFFLLFRSCKNILASAIFKLCNCQNWKVEFEWTIHNMHCINSKFVLALYFKLAATALETSVGNLGGGEVAPHFKF